MTSLPLMTNMTRKKRKIKRRPSFELQLFATDTDNEKEREREFALFHVDLLPASALHMFADEWMDACENNNLFLRNLISGRKLIYFVSGKEY